ncbi:MAG: ATP-binding cassette domain-containing protein [Crocinitomicaceae bacterium]|jgi:iron(III) transport system ATP-binding protein|nr:ATP-binding cassette domain-containing protein [Crocinitomicaceae bacterium]MDP5098556.1 ATP-binding cassette domain-containing protein [Crocinitomicaceae bacterium]
MLELSNIGIKRDDWVLRNINLTIEKGEIYGIIGKSGVGKTTLLKLMGGLIDASEGHVSLKGKKLIGPSEKLIPGYEEIQLVNQDFALEPYHTVEQNIKEKVLSRHKEDQVELIEQFLDLVELKDIRTRKAHLLSGGEQQRLAFARALACEPSILLLDEPFVHLDQRLRWKISKYLTSLNQDQKTTIVLVSHDGSEMMGFAHKIIAVADNGIQRIAKTKDVFYHPTDKSQGELMGVINSIYLNNELVLFRPNEYLVEGNKSFAVKFESAIDTGLIVCNYFSTNTNEKIMLTASSVLDEVKFIEIAKK